METSVAGRVDKFVALWMAGKSKGSDGIWYAVSTDAGQTWGSRTRLDPSWADPATAVGQDGRFLAAWLWPRDVNNTALYTAFMEQGQSTFRTPELRNNGGLKDFVAAAAGPAPGGLGSHYYYLGCFRIAQGPLLYTRWTTAGGWAPLEPVPKDPDVGEVLPSLAAAVSGYVYMT